jgi:hypothetical protein
MTDREKLIEILHKGVRCPSVIWAEKDCYYCPAFSHEEKACDEYAATADMLLANGVTVQKHGRWEKKWHDNDLIGREYEECPVCGCMISDTEKFWDCNFCPNCGARTDGE